jgi:ABC-2 type transport system permease protein
VGYFSLIRETLTLTKRSLTKWIRNPFAVIATLIQAIFWLALFGNSFNPAGAISSASAKDGSLGIFSQVFGGAANYITFLTPGVIAIAALTGMSFMGVDLVLERINGHIKVLSTYPIPRSSIYFGGVLQNIAKGMVQAPMTFLLAFAVPNGLRLGQGVGILNLLGIFGAIALLTTVFSTLFTAIAISIKTTDSFFAIVNFLTFPIMFTSTAFFPISFFPSWLKPVAQANPITLASEAARLLIVNGTLSAAQISSLVTDLVGLAIFGVFFAVVGTLMAKNALKPR